MWEYIEVIHVHVHEGGAARGFQFTFYELKIAVSLELSMWLAWNTMHRWWHHSYTNTAHTTFHATFSGFLCAVLHVCVFSCLFFMASPNMEGDRKFPHASCSPAEGDLCKLNVVPSGGAWESQSTSWQCLWASSVHTEWAPLCGWGLCGAPCSVWEWITHAGWHWVQQACADMLTQNSVACYSHRSRSTGLWGRLKDSCMYMFMYMYEQYIYCSHCSYCSYMYIHDMVSPHTCTYVCNHHVLTARIW